LFKLYSQGKNRINDELNISKVVKKLRHLQSSVDVLLKKDEQWKFHHDPSNVIDLNVSHIHHITGSDSECEDHHSDGDYNHENKKKREDKTLFSLHGDQSGYRS